MLSICRLRLYAQRVARQTSAMPVHQLRLVREDRDERVQHSIELMRAGLGERWTVPRLAKAVGLSRPAFARRFRASRGVSPLRYLVRERMSRAAELLHDTRWSLAQIG